jgi:hypothetical protein
MRRSKKVSSSIDAQPPHNGLSMNVSFPRPRLIFELVADRSREIIIVVWGKSGDPGKEKRFSVARL